MDNEDDTQGLCDEVLDLCGCTALVIFAIILAAIVVAVFAKVFTNILGAVG